MQDAGVFIRSNLVKDTWTCSRGSWEIEPAAFRLLNDPLFLLSHSPPSTADYTEERYFLYWCHITRENRARRPNLSLTDDCKLELNINTIIFLIRSHH